MCELDEHYCDVIISRWENFTGKAAVKVNWNNISDKRFKLIWAKRHSSSLSATNNNTVKYECLYTNKGWFAIDNNIDWIAIKNEYLGGGISQRKLADKHKIKRSVLLCKAHTEKWAAEREEILNKIQAETKQKIANEKASNAVIAERIRRKLLLQLESEIDRLDDESFSEEITRKIKDGGKIISKTIKKKNLIDVYMTLADEDIKREKLEFEKKKAEDDCWWYTHLKISTPPNSGKNFGRR